MNIEERIAQLRQQLHRYNHSYYQLDKSEVTDFEFDQLLKELHLLEKENPAFDDPNSPTKRVGGSVTKNFSTRIHEQRMYSCLLYTSPSPRDYAASRMPSSA